MSEVSCSGCAAQFAVAWPWPTLLRPLREEPFTPPAIAGRRQRMLVSCYNGISVGRFSRKIPCACRGYGSIVAQLRSMRESHLRDGGPRHSERPASALGPLSVRQHAFTAAQTVQQEQLGRTLTIAASSQLQNPVTSPLLGSSSLAVSWHGRLDCAAGLLLWLREQVGQH